MYCPMNCPNCCELQRQSEIIWQDSRDAIAFGYPLYEETISQTISLRLNRNLNSLTRVKKAPNESKNGADWLWFIYDSNSGLYLKFAVQAKRLDSNNLYGAVKMKQINDIRNFSKRKGFIPIYLFFNHNWDGFTPPSFLTAFIFQGIPAALGATYIHADHFANLTGSWMRKQSLSSLDQQAISRIIKQNSQPWFKLLCRCPGQSSLGESIVESIYRRILAFEEGFEFDEKSGDVEPKEASDIIRNWFRGENVSSTDLWSAFELSDWESRYFNPDFAMIQDVRIGKSDE